MITAALVVLGLLGLLILPRTTVSVALGVIFGWPIGLGAFVLLVLFV